jgi:RNA polymerase sigma factor (sigma-70 family)
MQEPRDETKRRLVPADEPGVGSAVAAFEEAYLHYGPRLRKIATGKFGIAPVDADGLVHDVFATYFMHASSVNKVEPYLIGAICNASRNHLRRSGTANVLFCDETPCAATPGDALAMEIERKVLLSRMLARVGGRCRELLRRYYVNGETTQCIATCMSSTPGTILVFLHRCRAKARQAYHSMTERH